jgi:16S rRNA (cytosine967-C5)-methyltransferase
MRPAPSDPARQIAFDTLRAVHADDAYANLVLPGLLRRARLGARDAALATELSYGTLRRQGFYDAVIAVAADRDPAAIDAPVLDALRLGAHQLLSTRIPAHAAVSATVALVRSRISSGAAGFTNAVLRRVSERDGRAWLDQLVDDPASVPGLALTYSHPAWIVRALRESLVAHGRGPTELPDLLDADNTAAKVTLLARPGMVDPAELIAAGCQPGRWSAHAVTMPGGDPAGLPAIADGRARVQDEGSQLVTFALAEAPLEGAAPDGGERWLDLCAGPGGKTALLAALAAQRSAHVTAVELSPHRADLVRGSVTGDEPVEVRTADGRQIGAREPGRYDRVLVDAPCTGLGALRRRPEARWRRTPADVATLAPLQRSLLESALAAVRPGGVVAYVTCSPHPAETLLVVSDVRRRRDADLLDATTAIGAVAPDIADLGPGPTAQLWPHRHGTDAMFLALLRG